MAKILVTGADGQVGREFRELESRFPQHHFLFCSRSTMDISDPAQVKETFAGFQPEYCVNCAAYTAVDKAETEQDRAFAINAVAVRHLAAACSAHQTRLVHISTDYVFDGNGTQPYKEDHPTRPVNIYGQSKLQGEEEAMKAASGAVVIRTSWVYSTYGNNFVKTMLRLMSSKPQINVVADQKGSPTYAPDLAEAVMRIIESGSWSPGIYHFSNTGIISWFDFATAIRDIGGFACAVQPIATSGYPTPAKRPSYSAMNTEKISTTYRLPLKPWRESLEACLKKMK